MVNRRRLLKKQCLGYTLTKNEENLQGFLLFHFISLIVFFSLFLSRKKKKKEIFTVLSFVRSYPISAERGQDGHMKY